MKKVATALQKIRVTEDTYHMLDDESLGVCRECLTPMCECEPDARKYKCDGCGAKAVYGVQELMLMGEITLVGTREQENVRV